MTWLLRFNLRTLFLVVALSCVYLGHFANWARERKEFSERVLRGRISCRLGEPKTPVGLRLFGDAGYSVIRVPDDCPRELIEEAAKLFPEAEIKRYPRIVIGCL